MRSNQVWYIGTFYSHRFHSLLQIMLLVFCCYADVCRYPAEGEDPYSMDNVPENLNYALKMKDGIVCVYDNAEALNRNQPHDLPYPDLETFAIELSHVLAMIADGPT